MSVAAEINGDDRLAPGDRLRYLWRNFRRNLLHGSTRPKTKRWQPPVGFALGIFSPGRCLTEAFLLYQLPQLLTKRKIAVLDVGCGSGRTSVLLEQAGFGGKYTGIDIDDRFAAGEGRFSCRFLQGDAHSVIPDERYDLIVSISALEHIPDDGRVIDRLCKAMTKNGLQLHFVPAPAGLAVYLWHGYRQYSTGAIGERFGRDGVTVYKLGGLASFLLHLTVITLPEILFSVSPRKRWPNWYRNLLGWCLRVDAFLPILPVCHVICQEGMIASGKSHV